MAEEKTDDQSCAMVTAHAPGGSAISVPHRFCDGWEGLSCGNVVVARAKGGAKVEGFVTGPEFASEVDLKRIEAIASPDFETLQVECAKNGVKLKVNGAGDTFREIMVEKTGRIAFL
ncbi:MAG: hypothetical protein JHD35_08280 [Sphingopyxis sp.]|nr:hypothetical protein [Sphingopyxis sp.]